MATEILSSKGMRWIGYVLSAVPILFTTVGGMVFLFLTPDKVSEGMVKYGYPASAAKPILIAEILCGLIYAIPQTAALGAVLLTAYLGGAVATHVHASEPFFFPIIFGALVWLGLWLRDARFRALLPLRKAGTAQKKAEALKAEMEGLTEGVEQKR